MNWTDLYSGAASGTPVMLRATTTSGPNQSVVTGAGQTVGNNAGTSPAFAWLGFVLALVLIRVLIALGGSVSA